MKKIILFLLLLIVAAFAITYFYASSKPTTKLVEQSIEIASDHQTIFNYIKYYKNQIEYSPWAKMDPNTQRTFQGTDGEIGSVHAWKSTHKQVGNGTLALKSIDQGKEIVWDLEFTEPFEVKSEPYMRTEFIDSNTTKVVWGVEMKMPVPVNAFLLESESANLAALFDQGLKDLKSILEN